MDDRRKFLEILRIEMTDLLEDIRALQEHTRNRSTKGEITDYVLKENVALLERESHGVASVCACLTKLVPEDYGSLDELVADIRSALADRHRCGGFEPVVTLLVERKLTKVLSYVHGRLPARPAG